MRFKNYPLPSTALHSQNRARPPRYPAAHASTAVGCGSGGLPVWKCSACDYRRTQQGRMYDRTQSVRAIRPVSQKAALRAAHILPCRVRMWSEHAFHTDKPPKPQPTANRGMRRRIPWRTGAIRPPYPKRKSERMTLLMEIPSLVRPIRPLLLHSKSRARYFFSTSPYTSSMLCPKSASNC